jgi:outer membrane protein assembly factor BamD
MPAQIDVTKDWSASRLYQEAKDKMAAVDYEGAIKMYETLEARFPYGPYAQQAQLEVGYAHYKNKDAAAAVAAADRFIKLHPNHPNVDYAYYLKGLANFNDDLGFMGSYTGQDMTERDPKSAREAFLAYKDLVEKFPDSRYRRDSIQRMDYLVDALASHEIHVASYYMRRGAFVAAVNRCQYSLTNYPQAPANEEGLLIMVNAYDKLGLTDLRNDAERVMNKNFPNSQYLAAKGKDKPWWTFFQIWNQ